MFWIINILLLCDRLELIWRIEHIYVSDSQLKQQVPQSLLTSPTSSDGSSYSPTTLNPFASSPDLLRTPLLFPSQSPATASTNSPPDSASFPSSLIAAPVPINPITPSGFPFSLMPNESLLQSILANYKLLEHSADFGSMSSESMDTQINNAIIDVCNVWWSVRPSVRAVYVVYIHRSGGRTRQLCAKKYRVGAQTASFHSDDAGPCCVCL